MLITVFTPTYNRATKLHRVFESLQKQNLKIDANGDYIFEWLIVDDGSNDGTKDLIDKWKKEVKFPIRYFYQENRGKIHAMRYGIELTENELFLICDSDDSFTYDTIETFFNIWNTFNNDEKEKCGGISVLCQDQYSNRIGADYPIENKLIPTLDIFFKWQYKGLGETWALLKSRNLKKTFVIPDEVNNLKFIPESFFWNKIVFEIKPHSYFTNKVLRVYYMNEDDNISQSIRQKYPDGFLFESIYFLNNYKFVMYKSPIMYIRHLIKFIIFSFNKKENFMVSFKKLDGLSLKVLFLLFLFPSLLYKKRYLKGI